MVIVKIWGGLGNQMFQFATAKALAVKNNDKLKMDISYFDKSRSNETMRHYRLNIFQNINEEFADKNEVNKILPQFRLDFLNKVYRNVNKKILNFNRSYKIENSLSYSEIILNNTNKTYLYGYWQSEKYFNAASTLIKKCFSLDHLHTNTSLKPTIELIESVKSVSIHVRRGDYVTNSSTNSFHGVVDLNYYERSIKQMVRTTSKDLTFFIFSDDIDWCKKNFKIPYAHFYITTNEDYYDLYLMSICRHNIIANSTFSWWGAWLNKHADKIVIAPKNWFSHQQIPDLIPVNWITN